MPVPAQQPAMLYANKVSCADGERAGFGVEAKNSSQRAIGRSVVRISRVVVSGRQPGVNPRH